MILTYFKDRTLRLLHSVLLLMGIALVIWSIFLTWNTRADTSFYRSTVGVLRTAELIAPNTWRIRAEYRLPDSSSTLATGIWSGQKPPASGEKILVHYNPYAFDKIEFDPLPPVQPQFLFFLSIMVGGLGFRFFIRYTFRNAKMKLIKEHGKKITPGEVSFEEYTTKVLMFLRLPVLRLHCRWRAFSGKEELDFFSEALPPGRKGEIDLSKVRVYYLPQDPRRYFLEVEDTGDTGKADTGKAV
jgi:hypothetical protein